MKSPVHVIGATGRSGRALCQTLQHQGETIIAVVRRPECLPQELQGLAHKADLTEPVSLNRALTGARRIVSTAHARYIPAILNATQETSCLIALGSTRKFTRWPDSHGNGVLAGEKALLNSGRRGLLLHPTMIYGAQGEDNVQRLLRLLKRLPVLPLPGGGLSLVQPIFQDDVTRALTAALALAEEEYITGPESLVIAGPTALPYRAFIATILEAAGMNRKLILPVPGLVLERLAPLASRLPGFPQIGRAEIRRLLEDKAFSVHPMQKRLGFTPRSLKEGLHRLFQSIPPSSYPQAGHSDEPFAGCQS